MKLIGVELVKQDDQSDQWIVTYRYQASSEREAMVHASDTVEKSNPGIVWVSGRSAEDCQRISDHILQNVEWTTDDPAVVKQRKDRLTGRWFNREDMESSVADRKDRLAKESLSFLELSQRMTSSLLARDLAEVIALEELMNESEIDI